MRGRGSFAAGAGDVGVERRLRDAGPGSRRPWRHRTGRAALASSARGRGSGTRVGEPQREIMLPGLLTVSARSAGRRRWRWLQAVSGFSALTRWVEASSAGQEPERLQELHLVPVVVAADQPPAADGVYTDVRHGYDRAGRGELAAVGHRQWTG